MPRKSNPTLRQMQRDAHLLSRFLGDANALQRGPEVLARRVIRRRLTRALFRGLR